jgi:hypothetical protein
MADSSLDCDLRKLALEDLAIVRRWAEDRLINAVTSLDIRLQLQQPGVLACDLTCQEARRTVERILGIVEEVRKLAAGSSQLAASAERKAHGAERRKVEQNNPDLMPLQNPDEEAI